MNVDSKDPVDHDQHPATQLICQKATTTPTHKALVIHGFCTIEARMDGPPEQPIHPPSPFGPS